MGDRSPLSKTCRAFGEAIDAAALDACAWQGVADFVGVNFPGSRAAIDINDFTGKGASRFVGYGFDASFMREYVPHYSHINPWLPFWSTQPSLRPSTMDETGQLDPVRKTEFCDWFLHFGEMDHATGMKIVHDHSRAAMSTIHYGGAVAEGYNRDIPHLLADNAIRLKRALDLNRITEDKAIAARVADFVAQLPNPAFVLDARCRIVEMNSAAEAELASAKQLRVTGSRILGAKDGPTSSRLAQAAAEIVAMEGLLSNGCDIGILDGGKTTLALFPFSPKALEGISCWTHRFGAIGGIDALAGAAVLELEEVVHQIVKPPRAWKNTPAEKLIDLDALTERKVFFSGTARQAAGDYPQNANATVVTSLAGIGLDKTRVEMVADPASSKNGHRITARGAFGRMEITLENNPLVTNPKSSELTALSLVRLIKHRVHHLLV